MLLSRHPCVSIYDVRHIVNVHEARVQMFVRPLLHLQTFNLHIDRRVGAFQMHANGQRVLLPIPATSWASWCVGQHFANNTCTHLDFDLECLQLSTKPGFATAALDMPEPIGILCLSRDNVDGGMLVGQNMQKELSPGYAAIVTGPCSLQWTPMRSFDGHGDAVMNVFVMRQSKEPIHLQHANL